MRYDDASQAGSTAASGPSAHPDVDTLAPGSFGPASGNAISGAGTTSGQAGADQVSAAPAAIVEVHGAGGQTVQANGAFQAAGQYGLLSMNADGDFNYVRNPGTPDGVQDVFNYTLADASGATSATTLTIDIGQVAAAAAGQGVVALPAGVELSDIHVNGRDLVINMPDGTQMVIPGGAVFVPELTIGDVQVPPTNLAALLVDSEPQPAAGPPQSSGNNFADPVPPLDPGVPLGDLIPPTELPYTPPEFHEVNQFDNTKPTIIIETPDNPAGAVNAVDSVDESGLPSRTVGGVSEPAGTLASQDIESTSGTILFTAQDGLDGVTINNVAVASVGQQIAGAHGTLTITSIDLDSGQIGYSYTATDNTTDGVNDFEDFTVIVTDNDGDTATGTLHINIEDDEPIALNDTDSTDLVTHVATGNVMTGVGTTSGASGADTVGADNATLTAVSSNNSGASDSSFDGSGNLVVEGEFGSLTIKADGSYVYTAHQNAPGGSSEVFTYTLTDGDGDPAQATLTITNPDHMPTAGANAVVQLDDDALLGGNPGGVGDDVDSAHTTGTLSGSGGDGALSFALTADGAPAGFTYALQSNGNLWVMQGSTHVLTITADSATGAYTVTQVAAIDHPAGNNENNVEFGISYTVTDADGDPATGHLTVNVDDDTPVARNDTDGLDSAGHAAGNVITGAATTSGAAGADGYGADGPGQLTGVSSNGTGQSDTSFDSSGNLVVHGSFGTLTIDANGEYTYVRDAGSTTAGSEVFTYTIVDGDGDPTTATLTIAVPNIDHTPTANTPAAVMVDDDDLPTGNHDNAPGDDDPANTSGFLTGSGGDGDLDFYFSATQTNLPTGFTATLVNAGELDIYQGTTHVLTVTLNNETGAYTVTEINPVQQASDDSENNVDGINIGFFAQDADGDHSNTAFLSISVDDDIPTAIIPPPPENPNDPTPPLVSGAVDEDDLPTGNNDVAPGDDLPINSSTTASGAAGSLGALFNAGADQPLTYGLSTDTSGLPALTSDGHEVLYAVDGGVLTGVADLDDSGTIDAGETSVFTLTVNEDGSWSFELQGQLDHPDPTTEDNLELDFSSIVTAVDTDGDPATAAGGAFVINVDDDSPTAVIPPVNPEHPNDPPPALVGGEVDEDDLPAGNNDVAPGDDLPIDSSTTASGAAGSLGALFNAGADQPLTFGLSIDTSALPALTSDGHAVLYAVDGGVLTGVADLDDSGTIDAGETSVFTLTVNEDGSWSFELQGQLDHPDPTTEDNLLLDFSSVITATDADGDPATGAPGAFVINVDDDSPQAFDGCPQETVGVNAAGTVIEDLSLNLPSVGADTPGVLSFGTIKDGDPVLDNDGHQLSSGGQLLYYSVNPSDPTILEARTDPTPGEGTLVFQIDLDAGAGTYTYHQYEAITAETELNITDLSSVGGGNVDAKAIDVPDSPFDLILSTSTGNTVNTSADWIGVSGGQSMSAGDVIRVDFVQDAFVTGSGGGAILNFGEYYAANAFREDVGGLNSNQFASFTVRAVGVNEASGSSLSDPADGDSVFYGDTNDAGVLVTQLNLYDTSGTLVDITAYNASNPGGDPDIVVTDNGDGSWTVEGLPQGFDFEITSTTPFQAVEVTAVEGSDTFKLGAIDITSVVEGSVDLTVPLTLTDSDGDPVSCDIDVILGPPTGTPDVTAQVDESALSSIGSNPGSDSETTGGDLSAIVSGGSGATFALEGDADHDGVVVGTHGTITLDQATGEWTYTLNSPVDSSPDADDGTNVEPDVESFTYQMIEGGEVVGTGHINIDVKDDIPTAVIDTDSVVEGASALGNVLTGVGSDGNAAGADTPGADGLPASAVVGVAAGDTDADLTGGVGVGGLGVTGLYGTLTLNADGSYTYTVPAGTNPPADAQDVFTYTIVDNDGDLSHTTITIDVINDNEPSVIVPQAGADGTIVDEAGLASGGLNRPGEPAGTGEAADGNSTNNDDTSETSSVGTITFNPGDTPSTVTINGTTVDSAGDTVAGLYGTLTIASFDAAGTITYTYTLNDNVDNTVVTGDEFTVAVTDTDGQTASDSFEVAILDDGPIARADTDSVVEGGSTNGDVLTGVGGDGNAAGADTPGADGLPVSAVVGVAAGDTNANLTGGTGVGGTGVHGTYGTLTLNADGTYTYVGDSNSNPPANATDVFTYTIVDNDGTLSHTTITIDVIDDLTPVAGEANAAVDDEALPGGIPGDIANGDIDADSGESGAGVGDESVYTGTLAGSGGDAPTSFLFEASLDGDTATVGDETVVYGVSGDGLTLTGTIDSTDASRDGLVLFTVAITDAAAGDYTLTLNENVLHPYGDGDESSVNLDIPYQMQDSDSDPSATAGTLHVEFNDDVPVLNSYTDAEPDAVENLTWNGTFDYDIGADSQEQYGATAHDISVALSGTLGDGDLAQNIQNVQVDIGSADEHTESFTFSFDYDPNPTDADDTASETATGSITFDKDSGTYSVVLDQPIATFDTVHTGHTLDKTTYNTSGSSEAQPEIVVSQLDDDFYVRFTGVDGSVVSGPTANTAWTAGEHFSGSQGWVSISGSENGVSSDTLQNGEVLDMDFFTADPGASGGTPDAAADNVFIKIGQFNSGKEDMVVILKLQSASDPSDVTTRAIVVDNTDVWLSSETNPYGLTFATGEDGVIIIESNDYNLNAGDDYQIVGMQLLTSTESVTSAANVAIDLNRDVVDADTGLGGASALTDEFDSATADQDVIKITDIGFIRVTTNTQDIHLDFDVTITDADGDTVNQTVSINPVVSALAVQSFAAVSTEGDKTALFVSNDNSEHQRAAAFGNGNAALLSAIAAAGLNSAHEAAARIASHDGDHEFQGLANAISGLSASVHGSGGNAGGGKSVDALVASHSNQHEAIVSHTAVHADQAQSQAHAGGEHHQAPQTELLQGTTSPAHGGGTDIAQIAAQGVIMPSAEQLAAASDGAPQASVAGQPQHNEVVGKVVADALHGGDGNAPNIEALVEAIGANGPAGNNALEALASHGMEAVPNGHIGVFAGFAGAHGGLMMDPMIVHQDAAPAHG